LRFLAAHEQKRPPQTAHTSVKAESNNKIPPHPPRASFRPTTTPSGGGPVYRAGHSTVLTVNWRLLRVVVALLFRPGSRCGTLALQSAPIYASSGYCGRSRLSVPHRETALDRRGHTSVGAGVLAYSLWATQEILGPATPSAQSEGGPRRRPMWQWSSPGGPTWERSANALVLGDRRPEPSNQRRSSARLAPVVDLRRHVHSAVVVLLSGPHDRARDVENRPRRVADRLVVGPSRRDATLVSLRDRVHASHGRLRVCFDRARGAAHSPFSQLRYIRPVDTAAVVG